MDVKMIENRELTMDDYLAMLRRRAKVILIPVLLGPLVGFLTYLPIRKFWAKWTAQSLVLVEGQKVPENMVQPVVSQDLLARISTLQQQVLSQSDLEPVVKRLFPGKNSQEAGEMIDYIRQNLSVEPVADMSQLVAVRRRPGSQSSVPGFYVKYTAGKPGEAQQVCNELTSLMLTENIKTIASAAKGTSDVLNKAIEDARGELEELGMRLATLNRQFGRQPGNLEIEVQRQLLTIDYEFAKQNYQELLAKKSTADLTIQMNNRSQGETMFIAIPPTLPDSPTFPVLWIFPGGGLGIGFGLGVALAVRTKLRGRRFRTTRSGPIASLDHDLAHVERDDGRSVEPATKEV